MGSAIALRRAGAGDVPYLSALASDPEVEPFLAPRAGAPERLEALLAQAEQDGEPSGLFVVEDSGEPIGGLALLLTSRNSRICELTRLMIDPRRRRSGIGSQAVWLACRRTFDEYGFHRVQAETYGDNLVGQRLFERVGFVLEGRRRRAYWRRDAWIDGVLYGVLVDELSELRPPDG